MNQLSFSGPSVFYSRVVLFFVLAIALTATLAVPLLWLNTWRAARTAERRYPQLGERLLTFVERRGSSDPFLPLLAADALPYATPASLNQIAAPSQTWTFAAIAALSTVTLLWMGTGGPRLSTLRNVAALGHLENQFAAVLLRHGRSRRRPRPPSLRPDQSPRTSTASSRVKPRSSCATRAPPNGKRPL